VEKYAAAGNAVFRYLEQEETLMGLYHSEKRAQLRIRSRVSREGGGSIRQCLVIGYPRPQIACDGGDILRSTSSM
jgi:hypothetical protein